ncbi:hypothetical protein ABIE26_002853 [Pedobacter africanus]
MGTIRILLVVFCLVDFGGTRMFGRGVVSYGTGKYEVAAGRSAPRKDARRLIEIAKAEIGVRELTENSSPRIDEYCAYLGLRKVAWCACWLSWCFKEAGFVQPRTAWCPALFPTARVVKEPLPGMVMGIYFPEKGRIAHCGIVEAIKGSFIVCLEGNTNVAGSREGDRVMRKLRHRRTIAKFSDWL